MMDILGILQSILAFIVAIGILVTIHEFGHYWVARLCGVKVLRFSVGFGKPIWMRQGGADNTEYAVAAIPLGGYVKMLDEREGPVDEQELDRAFNRQSVNKRFAIVAAGPIFNFIFAIVAYWLMFMNGVSGIKPYVGNIEPNSLAEQVQIQDKDLILSVNGIDTPSWEKARLTMMQQAIDHPKLELQLQDQDFEIRQVSIDTSGINFLQDEKTDLVRQMGMSMWRPQLPPVIDEVVAGGAAEIAGIKAGDLILSLDREPIQSVHQWVEKVRANPEVTMPLQVERDGREVNLYLTPAKKDDAGEIYGYVGVRNVVVIPQELRQQMLSKEQYGPFLAMWHAVDKTWKMSALTVKVLWKLVVGEASVKNLSGPITIAKYAGLSAQIGLEQFFAFLAIISISLGVLNLLPIPVLDGGHLFFYLIEMIKGSPVSEVMEAAGQRVGIALLMMLMTLAIYNDVLRLVE